MKYVSIILAILGIPLGFYLTGLGYTQPDDPLLNNILFLGGILLSGSALIYLLVRMVKHFVN
ncbi:hypothetical protein MgSA37_00642 [Mucilaginibacter gotjawali]|uniref:Formate-dependent nitrite reductase membrane component NrfD n=2 Tax=Mucilaginibacter gotjawali TaxID=1550579 RepID=A0A839SMG9_9SPHI|nr:formate-dependent nitrite reductase membrane component NrfD [Mucilaginibacter gotjawali]BAU52481.1 hypothetical protein MgSA37_00642 [Mucilaginibacter gotjawali]